MRSQFFCAIFLVMSAFQSHADTTLSVAYGPSVPVDTATQTYVLANGPSRAGGGEHFILKLNAAKVITDIKITGFSKARTGKALVHSVTASSGATAIAIPALSQFNKVTMGNPTNYNGSVMLTDSTYVEVTPNQAFSQLDFVIEGYSNDDSSILLQITTSDTLSEDQFMMTRTGPNSSQSIGSLIDETSYAKFSGNDLKKLMLAGAPVAAPDLTGKTFVCSSYTKLDTAEINLKNRTYLTTSSGTLQSNSDIEGSNLVWTTTSAGLATVIANQNGCGTYTTYNVVRRTPSGNLIAEVNLNLENYVQLCANAGYDADGTRSVETNSTFPSVIDPHFVVDSYEFCRLAN